MTTFFTCWGSQDRKISSFPYFWHSSLFVTSLISFLGMVFSYGQVFGATYVIEFWDNSQRSLKAAPVIQGQALPDINRPDYSVLSGPAKYIGNFSINDGVLGTPNGFISLTSPNFLSFNVAIDNASFEIPDDPLRLCGLVVNGVVRCEPESDRLGIRLDPDGELQRFDIPSSFVSNGDSIVDTDFDIANSPFNRLHPQLVLWDRDPEGNHPGYFVQDDDGDWVLLSGTTAQQLGWIEKPQSGDEVITPLGKMVIDGLVHDWSTFNWHGTDPGFGQSFFRISPVSALLTVLKNGTGSGTVTSDPLGIDCPDRCSKEYRVGRTVTLTASPEPGSTFAGWSGGTCTGTGPCSITLTNEIMVTATFNLLPLPPPDPVTLQVILTGTGSGTVTSGSAGITCGTDCSESYSNGTGVTLTASANPGSLFLGWSGGGCSGTTPCVLTLTANTTVSAVFVNPLVTRTRHDLNGDDKADLVWRNNSSGVVAVWLMNGGKIGSSGFPGGLPLEWQIVGMGDVDKNGTADVIWRHNTSGAVAVWLMNGLTISSVRFPGSTSTDWTIEGVGDVNGDGQADLVWRNTSSGVVALWLMNGGTILSSGFLGSVPLEWQIAGIGDVTADGQADVIWRHNTSTQVAIWVMNGLTIHSIGFPGRTSPDWAVQAVGDVNGDGRADLVWRNTSSGVVAVWHMNGTVIGSTGFPAGVSLAWQIAQVVDVNGDGKADVIWRHGSSSTVAIWLMDGLSINSVGFPGSASTVWELQ